VGPDSTVEEDMTSKAIAMARHSPVRRAQAVEAVKYRLGFIQAPLSGFDIS